MKITAQGRDHQVGNPQCPGCDHPDGKHWPQPHSDGLITCPGLVHCDEVPAPGHPDVVYRCDACDDAI